MQIVIDIPENVYKEIYSDAEIIIYSGMRSGKTLLSTLLRAVRKGTPLPKGHGRILDEKDILNTFAYDGQYYDLVDMPEYIAGVKEIIEADKAESKDGSVKRVDENKLYRECTNPND